MIPNITRGGDVRGVITYLVGKGRQEEHVDPHLVAGSAEAVMLTEGHTLDNSDIAELTRLLDEPRVSSGVRVRLGVRDERGVKHLQAAHVWHCSLSLHPSEAEQSDERWREISERFVDRMGFDSPALDDEQALRCEWVAIRHGRSAGGSDHAHIVVQLVSESGIAASTHYERLRAQQVCRELESSFGLLHVEARERAAGERGIKPGELDADRKRGRVVRDEHGNELPEQGSRRTLERIVRACATASADETEFVAALRQRRVLVHPRWAKGGQERVEGYSVALPPPEGEQPVWYSGGRLSRELTLPRLRTGWNAVDDSATAAAWKSRRAITRRRSPGPTRALSRRTQRSLTNSPRSRLRTKRPGRLSRARPQACSRRGRLPASGDPGRSPPQRVRSRARRRPSPLRPAVAESILALRARRHDY